MAAQPAPLDPGLVKRGSARPVDPMDAATLTTHDPGPAEAPTAPTPAPAHSAPGPMLRPVPLNTVQRKAGTLRLPIAISEGLRNMSHYTRRPMQSILEEGAVRMLDDWNPNWRDLLPEG